MGASNNLFNIEFIEEVSKDPYSLFDKDNTFCVFESIYKILCIVHATIEMSIIIYDLVNKTKIVEIKNAHKNYIIEFRHYLDEINKNKKRDLILSSSFNETNIKIWDFNNVECIFNINPYTNNRIMNSLCFLYDNISNEILIIASCLNPSELTEKEPIKVFDLKGEKTKEMVNSSNEIKFIEAFYDRNKNKNFIISSNWKLVISYDYNENKEYHQYKVQNYIFDCSSLVIYNDKENEAFVKMIQSGADGSIYIWDFHSAILLNKIKVSDRYIFSICLLNGKNLFVCGKEKSIKIEKIRDENTNFDVIVLNGETTGKLIKHPIYGDCLISKSIPAYGPLKLWKIKI